MEELRKQIKNLEMDIKSLKRGLIFNSISLIIIGIGYFIHLIQCKF